MNLEAPSDLPSGLVNLSNSSIDQYLRCPQKWFNKYILKLYEPKPGHLVLGRAVHVAETQSYSDQVTTGQPHELEQVMDDYSTQLEHEIKTELEIEWGDMTAGQSKDRGARMLADYHSIIPYKIQPHKTETEFNIRLHPDYRWTIKGYVDIIGDIDDGFWRTENAVQDLKTVKRAISEEDMNNNPQGTLYTYSQMLSDPALVGQPFVVHELKATKTTVSNRLIETYRTRQQGERYMERVAQIAREIEWRMETDNWQGAPPGAWWCRPGQCGFYATCQFAVGRP